MRLDFSKIDFIDRQFNFHWLSVKIKKKTHQMKAHLHFY